MGVAVGMGGGGEAGDGLVVRTGVPPFGFSSFTTLRCAGTCGAASGGAGDAAAGLSVPATGDVRADRVTRRSIWVDIDSTRLASAAFSCWRVRTSFLSDARSCRAWASLVAQPDTRRRAAAAAMEEM